MKQLNQFINEKLKLDQNIKDQTFTDEELMDDYEGVTNSFSKSDKKPYMDKYACDINKIRDIQLVILDLLRENRQKRKDFNDKDVRYFLRYDIPWARYEKAKEYMDKEPKDFIEYVLDYYEAKARKIHPFRQSIAEKYTLRIYNSLKRYLRSI